MDVKEKIVCGAQKMFIKFGIRSITMDMIAEDLGISKRTIYENFKDKDELLISCIENGISSSKKDAEEILRNSVNVIEAMTKLVKYHVKILKTINPLFMHDIKKYYAEVNDNLLADQNKHSINMLVNLLNRGIHEGLFRKEINVTIVATSLFEQFKIIGNNDIYPEDQFSKAELYENIVVNFMRGIATQEGHAMIEKYNV
jgi:AcrR family transcriptional regulator